MHQRPSTLLSTAVGFASFALTASSLLAAAPPFTGKWAINLEKSQLTGSITNLEQLGNNEYREIFDGHSEPMITDGKEHLRPNGIAYTITPDGANQWRSVNARNGKVMDTGIWKVSDDEKVFTIHTEVHHPDGTTGIDEARCKRLAGTAGLAGVWEDVEISAVDLPELVIEAPDADTLTLSTPALQKYATVKLDGQDAPYEGPPVAPGLTVSAKRIDDHTLELTNKFKGKIMDTQLMTISADGKTLTTTLTYPSLDRKEVRVRDRK